jgi:hypothetical protein
MSVSTQKPARWFAPAYGDLRPSGSSHAEFRMLLFTIQGIESPTSPVWQTRTRLIGYFNEKVGGIRCELAIGDGWGALSRRNHFMSEMGP